MGDSLEFSVKKEDKNKKEKEKRKQDTFMDYYNSVPNKSPTNLLEKYIKRKK